MSRLLYRVGHSQSRQGPSCLPVSSVCVGFSEAVFRMNTDQSNRCGFNTVPAILQKREKKDVSLLCIHTFMSEKELMFLMLRGTERVGKLEDLVRQSEALWVVVFL